MGMIETRIKKTPAGMVPAQYLAFVQNNVNRLCSQGDEDGDRPEGGKAWIVTPEQFEEVWNDQENIKKELKDKYRLLVEQGQVVAIEIDW